MISSAGSCLWSFNSKRLEPFKVVAQKVVLVTIKLKINIQSPRNAYFVNKKSIRKSNYVLEQVADGWTKVLGISWVAHLPGLWCLIHAITRWMNFPFSPHYFIFWSWRLWGVVAYKLLNHENAFLSLVKQYSHCFICVPYWIWTWLFIICIDELLHCTKINYELSCRDACILIIIFPVVWIIHSFAGWGSRVLFSFKNFQRKSTV